MPTPSPDMARMLEDIELAGVDVKPDNTSTARDQRPASPNAHRHGNTIEAAELRDKLPYPEQVSIEARIAIGARVFHQHLA